MNSFIYFEDLVANALIEKIIHHEGRHITSLELIEYGKRIVDWWKKNKKIDVTILSSKYDTDKAFSNYYDFFTRYFNEDDGFIIYLNNGKTADDLRKKFRSYLSVDMLLCFIEAYEMK